MYEWLVVRRPRPKRRGGLESPKPYGKTVSETEAPEHERPMVENAATRKGLPQQDEIDTAAPSMPISLIKPLISGEALATKKLCSRQRRQVPLGASARLALIRNGLMERV